MNTPPYIFDEHNDEYSDDQQLQLISPVPSFSPPDTPLSLSEEPDDWDNGWTLDSNDYSLVLDCQYLTAEPCPIDTTTTDDLRSNLAGLGISVPDRHHNTLVAENLPSLPSNDNNNTLVAMDDNIFFQDSYYYHQSFPKKADIQRHNSLRHSARRSSSSTSTSSNTTTTTTTTIRDMSRHSTTDHCA